MQTCVVRSEGLCKYVMEFDYSKISCSIKRRKKEKRTSSCQERIQKGFKKERKERRGETRGCWRRRASSRGCD